MAETVFGKYRLIAELGSGGMAEVFLAVSPGPAGFGKLLVVKRLRPNLAEDPDFVAMFMDEARLAARLNHPNVVQTNDVGQLGDQYYIAMEFLDGQPLHRVQSKGAKSGGFSKELNYLTCVDLLAGLHYAHELKDYDGTPIGIVHRDVSPQNVFVTYEGSVKVVDFGIAKATGRAQETAAGVLKGKIRYMSPEQAINLNVDRRADIFCVGVMVWEIATGERFWSRDLNDVAVIQKLLSCDFPTSPASMYEGIPPEIDRICRKALAPIAGDRYSSAQEMQKDLEAFLNREGKIIDYRRELGPAVAAMFADGRDELQAVINGQLARLKDDPSHGSLKMAVLDSSEFGPASSSKNDAATIVSVSEVMGVSSPAPGGSEKSPAKMGRWGLIGVVILSGLIGLGVTLRRKSQTPAAGIATSVGQDQVPQRSVRIRIAAPYSSARILIDGKVVANPFQQEVPSAPDVRAVRIEAPGFIPYMASLVFDRDIDREITLEVLPTSSSVGNAAVVARGAQRVPFSAAPARPVAPPVAAAVAPPADSAPPAPTNGKIVPKKRGEIDNSNPYQ